MLHMFYSLTPTLHPVLPEWHWTGSQETGVLNSAFILIALSVRTNFLLFWVNGVVVAGSVHLPVVRFREWNALYTMVRGYRARAMVVMH